MPGSKGTAKGVESWFMAAWEIGVAEDRGVASEDKLICVRLAKVVDPKASGMEEVGKTEEMTMSEVMEKVGTGKEGERIE